MYYIDSSVESPDFEYLIGVMSDSMKEGIALQDMGKMNSEFLKYQRAYALTLHQNYGIENPNSYKQVLNFLQNIQDDEITAACQKDDESWTTDAAAMTTLALVGYEFAKVMLMYRKAKSFAQATKQFMDAQFYSDRRAHPTVSVAKTNRIQYSEPPLLSIPKTLVWSMIKPRTEGNYLFSADIKYQEPCIMINMLNIESLKPALSSTSGLYECLYSCVFSPRAKANLYVMNKAERRELSLEELSKYKDIDPEVYADICTADSANVYVNDEMVSSIPTLNIICSKGEKVELPSEIAVYSVHGERITLDVSWDAINKTAYNKGGLYTVNGTIHGIEMECLGVVRDSFKRGWNSLTYGSSKMGVQNSCKHINGGLLYDYFYSIPEFAEYRLDCGRRAKAGKQETTTYFGSNLRANEAYKSALKRVLMDIPVQGTGADILALLVKHFDIETELRGIDGLIWIYFSRHDELVFEAEKQWVESIGVEAVSDILRDILEHQVDDWVPFQVKVGMLEGRALEDILAELDMD